MEQNQKLAQENEQYRQVTSVDTRLFCLILARLVNQFNQFSWFLRQPAFVFSPTEILVAPAGNFQESPRTCSQQGEQPG